MDIFGRREDCPRRTRHAPNGLIGARDSAEGSEREAYVLKPRASRRSKANGRSFLLKVRDTICEADCLQYFRVPFRDCKRFMTSVAVLRNR